MKSILLHIKTNTEGKEYIRQKQETYSNAKRVLYRRATSDAKKEVLEEAAMKEFGMNTIEARSLASEVKSFFDKAFTEKQKKENRVAEIEEEISKIEAKNKKEELDLFEKRKLFRLRQTLVSLNKSILKQSTFGTKEALRTISYLNNAIRKPSKNKEETDEEKKEKEEFKSRLVETKTKYVEDRRHAIYLLGEANQQGNRFFDFDLPAGKIIYKPKKGVKIEMEFKDTRSEILSAIQLYIDSKTMPVTVFLSENMISLSYDDEILHDYNIDEKSRKAEVVDVKRLKLNEKEEKLLINTVYTKFYKQRDLKIMHGKKKNRYIAFDSNPNYIGIAVLDRLSQTDGDAFKIVAVWYYDLSKLNGKLPKSATLEQRLAQTNKRKHGILHIWKDVFERAKYLQCGTFICEDLELKAKEGEQNAKEANRLTKNMWHRDLSTATINSKCIKYGIKKIKTNAAYTSTIGNVSHSFVDCINAAIEIGRRGSFDKIKGTFYPGLPKTGLHAMSRSCFKKAASRDVEVLEGWESWVELHVALKKSGCRYRKSLRDILNKNEVSDLWVMEQAKGESFAHLLSSKLNHSDIAKHEFIIKR